MWGIPFVLLAVAAIAFAIRESGKDGTEYNRRWGFPLAASLAVCAAIVGLGVLLSWGAAIAL